LRCIEYFSQWHKEKKTQRKKLTSVKKREDSFKWNINFAALLFTDSSILLVTPVKSFSIRIIEIAMSSLSLMIMCPFSLRLLRRSYDLLAEFRYAKIRLTIQQYVLLWLPFLHSNVPFMQYRSTFQLFFAVFKLILLETSRRQTFSTIYRIIQIKICKLFF